MSKSSLLGLYSKSFLNCFPSDKENNPNSINSITSAKLSTKRSLDLTEKMYKMPPVLMKSQDFSCDALKKYPLNKNKKTLHVQKEELPMKEIKEINEKKSIPLKSVYSYREVENTQLNNIYSKEIIKSLRENEVY